MCGINYSKVEFKNIKFSFLKNTFQIINLLKIKNLLKTEGMTIKGAKIKIKNFKIDTKTSIDILPVLKEILKEL